jgi:pyruvate/2-oxoglutarate dehydrogenase complex dihydrolipoamide dehydrogenase (E3) component
MDGSFDMIVIGAGPAGEKAAAQAAYFGKRVAVVDRAENPGGSAVRSAGVPTKTLRETATMTDLQARVPSATLDEQAAKPDVRRGCEAQR